MRTLASLVLVLLVIPCSSLQLCKPEVFSFPSLLGTELVLINATTVDNHKISPRWAPEAFRINEVGISFCNVTVSYTHPGQNDLVNVQIWLPLHGWNERFMGIGGGGFATGAPNGEHISVAVHDGYAAATTDGGHISEQFTAPWVLISPGNINYPLLFNFASIALNDMTLIGKAMTEQYYGKSPKYSYWNGCSTGGRQGLMMAQAYPEAYNGILANCPAINMPSLSVGGYWPQLVMNLLNHYPKPCELQQIENAAIEECDEFDGVKDGIVSAPDQCHFDPQQLVGQTISCEGATVRITKQAALVAAATWEGSKSEEGKSLWFGAPIGTSLIGPIALANTLCNEEDCTGLPMPIGVDWIRLFLKKDPNYDLTSMTRAEFERLLHASQQQYDSIIGANDPDLSEFKKANGKMITWHGLNDQLITVYSTRQYYKQVINQDDSAADYYRYFEVPGVGHCGGGPGVYPMHAMDSLRRWVEEGVPPNTLDGTNLTASGEHRPVCQYPLVAVPEHNNAKASFTCVPSFPKHKDGIRRDEL